MARDGKVVLITGSPGSRTIINTVLCVVVNVIDFDMDIRAAVDAPRLHHPWFPDEARFEGIGDYPEAVAKLKAMGHKVSGISQGDAHSIWVDPKTGAYQGRRIGGSMERWRGIERGSGDWVRRPATMDTSAPPGK